jgi:hypothetical protein
MTAAMNLGQLPRSTSTGALRVLQTPRRLSRPLAPSARISARRFASASISALSEVCPGYPILRPQAGGSALQPVAEGDRSVPLADALPARHTLRPPGRAGGVEQQ